MDLSRLLDGARCQDAAIRQDLGCPEGPGRADQDHGLRSRQHEFEHGLAGVRDESRRVGQPVDEQRPTGGNDVRPVGDIDIDIDININIDDAAHDPTAPGSHPDQAAPVRRPLEVEGGRRQTVDDGSIGPVVVRPIDAHRRPAIVVERSPGHPAAVRRPGGLLGRECVVDGVEHHERRAIGRADLDALPVHEHHDPAGQVGDHDRGGRCCGARGAEGCAGRRAGGGRVTACGGRQRGREKPGC